MPTLLAPTRVNDACFQTLHGLIATSPHTHPCPEYSDEDRLRPGVQRVLERVESGRAFLQEHGPRFDYQPTRPNYFAALQSQRRLDLARDVNRRLLARATQGQRVALTHNLLLIHEARLEREHGVSNAAEDERRQERHREAKQAAWRSGSPLDDPAPGSATGHPALGEVHPMACARPCMKTSRKPMPCPA